MTREDFFKAANIWYTRMIGLKRIILDESESRQRRIKAIHLYVSMSGRIDKAIQISIEYHIKSFTPVKFKKGGI